MRHFIPNRLGLYTQKIVEPVFKSRGLMEGRIITHWDQIVGEEFARFSLPEKVTFPQGQRKDGTLHISVTPSGALLFQYAQDLILEKINTFFGYKALAQFRMTHGFVPPQPILPPLPEKPLSPEKQVWLDSHTQAIPDLELKELLQKLGSAIL